MRRSSRPRKAGLATPNSSPPESARSSADPRQPLRRSRARFARCPATSTCSANNYPELDDDSLGWVPQSVSSSASFTWKNTANHRTLNGEYFIGDTRIAVFDGHNEQPPVEETHTVDLSRCSGRQKLCAVWNIGDTAAAFYSCVDRERRWRPTAEYSSPLVAGAAGATRSAKRFVCSPTIGPAMG
ncbi:lytic polysaccharide monooxygenase [Nocardia fluminea]|uniref:lytic polysaccharide monooxygenase n=1 Tax=Nocardia fluminea TaxID=134984 RepID=UPI0033D99838